MVRLSVPRRAQWLMAAGGAVCTAMGATVLWKDFLGGDVATAGDDGAPSQEGRVFVVTGANSGIGKEVSWELARRGGRVYMACRDVDRCEAARREIVVDTRNKYVYCRQCDLASLSSVRAFVEQLKAKEDRVHALINNAGVMHHPRSTPGRIVYLTSLDYRSGEIKFDDLNSQEHYDKTAAFTQSQLANMLMVTGLAKKFKKDGILVNAAYPGVVGGTRIKRHMGIDRSISGSLISRPLLWFLTITPAAAAKVPVYLATTTNGSNSGELLGAGKKRLEVEACATDEAVAERLMAVAKYWSGQSDSKEEVVRSFDLKAAAAKSS